MRLVDGAPHFSLGSSAVIFLGSSSSFAGADFIFVSASGRPRRRSSLSVVVGPDLGLSLEVFGLPPTVIRPGSSCPRTRIRARSSAQLELGLDSRLRLLGLPVLDGGLRGENMSVVALGLSAGAQARETHRRARPTEQRVSPCIVGSFFAGVSLHVQRAASPDLGVVIPVVSATAVENEG